MREEPFLFSRRENEQVLFFDNKRQEEMHVFGMTVFHLSAFSLHNGENGNT
jgi:hypothetical protein